MQQSTNCHRISGPRALLWVPVLVLSMSLAMAAGPDGPGTSHGKRAHRSATGAPLELVLECAGPRENGLGVAVTFNSRQLRLVDVRDVLAAGLLALSDGPEADVRDMDRDPSTDSLVRLAWLSATGAWPGGTDGVELAHLVFARVMEEDTAPHVDVVSLSPGEGLCSPPARLRALPAGEQGRTGTVLSAPRTSSVPGVVELARSSWRVAKASGGCSLDLDGDWRFDALTDGVLALRHLSGFTGASLVDGATGEFATRTTGDDVAEYLAAIECLEMLDVDRNADRDVLTDGVLAARYLFGFSGEALVADALAADALRSDSAAVRAWLDLHADSGSALTLLAPRVAAPLLSGMEARMRLEAWYTGALALTFSLLEGPPGMAADEHTGTLTWTPPESLEGSSSTVRAGVTDGELAAEVSFTLQVAASTPIATSVSGSTVTVTEAGSLHGLTLTLPAGASMPAGQVEVATVPVAQAQPPSGVIRLSDLFRASPVEVEGDEGIVVTMPAEALPAGRRPEELRLYTYVEHALSLPVPFWSPVARNLDVLPGGSVQVELMRLGHLSFVGLPAGAKAVSAASDAVGKTGQCSLKRFSDGSEAYDWWICPPDGDDGIEVTIVGLAMASWGETTPTADTVAGWITQARSTFRPLGMQSAPSVWVYIHQLPVGLTELGQAEGYCDPATGDLHIRPDLVSLDRAKLDVTHEFFHHGQIKSESTSPGRWPLFNTYPTSSWLIEGSARWFEDEVWDGLDSYATDYPDGFPPILTKGLAATQDSLGTPGDPYARFAFLKWLDSRCGSLSFAYLLNPHRDHGVSGLETLAAFVEDWPCDFGGGFGSSNSGSFATALLGFSAATIWIQDLSLLQADESPPGWSFYGRSKSLVPSVGCDAKNGCPDEAQETFALAPASARTLVVQPAEGLATLEVTADLPTWVSVWSVEEIPLSNPASFGLPGLDGVYATWFRTDQERTMEYGNEEEERSPGLFVTVVNPDPVNSASVNALARLEAGPAECYRLDVAATGTSDCPVNESLRVYLRYEGGNLVLDESVPSCWDPGVTVGTLTEAAAAVTFTSSGVCSGPQYNGSFDGTRFGSTLTWRGPAQYSYTSTTQGDPPMPCGHSGSDPNAILQQIFCP